MTCTNCGGTRKITLFSSNDPCPECAGKYEIYYPHDETRVPVTGLIVGAIGVRQLPDDWPVENMRGMWALDHLASGCRVVTFHGEQEAIDWATKLNEQFGEQLATAPTVEGVMGEYDYNNKDNWPAWWREFADIVVPLREAFLRATT